MHTVRDLLIRKPPKIVMIDPRCTMLQTLLKMGEHGVGALLVADNEGNLAGIVTEHDISKGAVKFGDTLLKQPDGGPDYVRYHRQCRRCAGDDERRSNPSFAGDRRWRGGWNAERARHVGRLHRGHEIRRQHSSKTTCRRLVGRRASRNGDLAERLTRSVR